MRITIVDNDHVSALKACFDLIQALRPELDEPAFIRAVRRMQPQGYRLALLETGGRAVALAGFRISESLAWRRYLYVDDLVTRPEDRSKGYGARLLEWLQQHAAECGCKQIHLDCGMPREAAHRFYQSAGFQASALHFHKPLHSR
ncbi:MAG: GNAT family N-acetyltransferase [Candidatus Thiodiazotropha sp.]